MPLEVVGLESADPRWIVGAIDALQGKAYRVRSIGSIAITLSYVACGRFDGMFSARGCRSVDAAAAQLIVREAGGEMVFVGFELEAEAALDLDSPLPGRRDALARAPRGGAAPRRKRASPARPRLTGRAWASSSTGISPSGSRRSASATARPRWRPARPRAPPASGPATPSRATPASSRSSPCPKPSGSAAASGRDQPAGRCAS